MKNLQVTYELKIQVLENNQLKFKTKGDLEVLKVNLQSLNKSKCKNMRTEVSNSIKPLQDSIFIKESSVAKKVSKDDIINELRKENADLKLMVTQLIEQNAKLAADNARLTADNARLTADNARLTAQVEKLTAQVEKLTADNARLTADNARLTAQVEKLSLQ